MIRSHLLMPKTAKESLKLTGYFFLSIGLCLSLIACNIQPPVSALDRIFGTVSLDFVDQYSLPKQTFEDTLVGGLSGIVYDRQSDRYYAISDDRSYFSPARFYKLKLDLNETGEVPKIQNVTIESVTFLRDATGELYAEGTIDPEGIALSPRQTVFISSEGNIAQGINPFVGEFDINSGKLINQLPIPKRYFPDTLEEPDNVDKGVRNNLAFESLAIADNTLSKDDPFRLFLATESSLAQDNPPRNASEEAAIRLMHYVVNPIGPPVLIGENLYRLEAASQDTMANGLSELLVSSREGDLFSLERTLDLSGFSAKIFQVVNNNATDTSRMLSLPGDLDNIRPLQKKLLFDLESLDIDLENLEGMTLGPQTKDGRPTLLLISDDNFREDQVTQFLLFRIQETHAQDNRS